MLVRIAAALLFLSATAGLQANDRVTDLKTRVFFEAPDFSVTERDLALYLSSGRSASEDLSTKSAAAINQGLSDLYALNVLASEANLDGDLMSDEEKNWIGNFAVINELVKRILQKRLDEAMEGIDLEQIALEEYTANPQKFASPETIVVRTVLLATDCASVDQATQRMSELLVDVDSEDEFIAMVKEHTDDEAAKAAGGLIRVTKGATVKPFEDAAFALTEPGEISEPVVSEFGVHALYLVEREPSRIPKFAEVLPNLLPEIEQRTKNNVLENLRMHGRIHRPDGLIVHQEAIDAFLADLKN